MKKMKIILSAYLSLSVFVLFSQPKQHNEKVLQVHNDIKKKELTDSSSKKRPFLSQFILSGEIRPRMEYRHGYKMLANIDQDAAAYVDQRSRLNFDFISKSFKTRIVLQDVRGWGTTAQLNNSDAFSSIHEAWGEVFLKKGWSIRLGRQEIMYDDHRIFGNVGWAQQARSHDAMIIKYQKDGFSVDVTGAYNQDGASLNGTNSTIASYKSLQNLWVHKNWNENIESSFLFLNLGKQVTDPTSGDYWDNYTQTIGTSNGLKKDKLSIFFNAYYQMGKTDQIQANDLSAYNVLLDVGYKLNKAFSTNLCYEVLSGNSQMDTSTSYVEDQHAFNPVFGTNHKFNGFMDHFYVGNWNGNVGLQDIAWKVKYKKNKCYVGLDFHVFMSQAAVFDEYKYNAELAAVGGDASLVTKKEMNSYLGTEIDFSFGFALSDGVMLKGGYSHMLGSQTLASLQGITYTTGVDAGKGRADQISNWGYIMVVFKPTFFQTTIKK